MQCEDKDPTLYHLASARRGCWIIYKILISIPDCHSPFVRTLCSSSSISIVSPALNNIAFSCLLTCWKPQCLLKMSAGLMSPGRWWKEKMFAATADRTRWYDKISCHFLIWEWGTVLLMITAWLSPNITDRPWGTPIYLRVVRRSMICSVAVRAAVNSDP